MTSHAAFSVQVVGNGGSLGLGIGSVASTRFAPGVLPRSRRGVREPAVDSAVAERPATRSIRRAATICRSVLTRHRRFVFIGAHVRCWHVSAAFARINRTSAAHSTTIAHTDQDRHDKANRQHSTRLACQFYRRP